MQTSATFLMAIWIGKVVLAENNDPLALTFAYPIASMILGVRKPKDFQPPISVAGDVNLIAHQLTITSLNCAISSIFCLQHSGKFALVRASATAGQTALPQRAT